jgi:hypothetical protein
MHVRCLRMILVPSSAAMQGCRRPFSIRTHPFTQVAVWGTRSVFAATAVFPLLVCVSALLIDEKPVVTSRTQRASERC